MQSEEVLTDNYFVRIIMFMANLELETIGQKDITQKVRTDAISIFIFSTFLVSCEKGLGPFDDDSKVHTL